MSGEHEFEPDDKRLRFIPVDQATAPPDGIISHHRDHWWAVCPERGLIYFDHSPQCNRNEDVARQVLNKIYPWAEVRFFPSVFGRVNPQDYCHC